MYAEHRIAAIVPAYNEEKLIRRTLSGMPDYIDCIYVINDCSTDATAERVQQHIRETGDQRIVLIQHEVNSGVGQALKTGYSRGIADGMDIMAVLAGDNQMDPVHLPKLLDPIVNGRADYTKGNRLYARDAFATMSRFRAFGNGLLTLLTKVSSGCWHITDPQNGYTAVSREALETVGVDSIFHWYGYCNDMLAKFNAFDVRVMDVKIPAVYGEEKSSIKIIPYMFRLSGLLRRNFFWRMRVKYIARDFHPLVFFYLFGALFTLMSLVGGLYGFYFKFVVGGQLFPLLSMSTIVFGLGMQFLFFAMYFDMAEAKRLNEVR